MSVRGLSCRLGKEICQPLITTETSTGHCDRDLEAIAKLNQRAVEKSQLTLSNRPCRVSLSRISD